MDRRYKKRIDRYWSKMEKQCEDALSRIDPNDWFNLWHTHPDWDGKGNSRPENRIRAIELTFQFLVKAEALTNHRNNEVQCFAIVKKDTMDNSIYIHSENPNYSEFPFKYEGVSWDIENKELESIVNLNKHQIGVFQGEEEPTFFIRKVA
ncbi:hypothetical protein [Pseudoalteromonas spongiae]|uniref:hypothetical protein n=1 Tax=Pseudoalteromonas spongiae TaxID=298657 RepID=UPI003734E044